MVGTLAEGSRCWIGVEPSRRVPVCRHFRVTDRVEHRRREYSDMTSRCRGWCQPIVTANRMLARRARRVSWEPEVAENRCDSWQSSLKLTRDLSIYFLFFLSYVHFALAMKDHYWFIAPAATLKNNSSRNLISIFCETTLNKYRMRLSLTSKRDRLTDTFESRLGLGQSCICIASDAFRHSFDSMDKPFGDNEARFKSRRVGISSVYRGHGRPFVDGLQESGREN